MVAAAHTNMIYDIRTQSDILNSQGFTPVNQEMSAGRYLQLGCVMKETLLSFDCRPVSSAPALVGMLRAPVTMRFSSAGREHERVGDYARLNLLGETLIGSAGESEAVGRLPEATGKPRVTALS